MSDEWLGYTKERQIDLPVADPEKTLAARTRLTEICGRCMIIDSFAKVERINECMNEGVHE